MNSSPQQRIPRAPRMRPSEFTPAVLRATDGGCTSGELQVFSVTGGLLSLPKLLNKGSQVKLMFLTKTGPVLGVAEMLNPISWTEQPFKFITLEENDQRRLRAAIPGSANWIMPTTGTPAMNATLVQDKVRVPKQIPVPQQKIAQSLPPVSLQTAIAQSNIVPTLESIKAPLTFDHDQPWITKYRQAMDANETPRKSIVRMFYGAFAAATLALGTIYIFHAHLLR